MGKCLKINGKNMELKREPRTYDSDSADCSECECLYFSGCYSKSVEG